MIKYPKQIKSIIRKTKTLGVDAELFLPSNETAPPLEMHSNFSRFTFSLIEKKGDTTIFPTANIPVMLIPYIKKMTDIAIDIHMHKKYLITEPKEVDTSFEPSVAYEVKLVDRTFKGKTPAEVLLEDSKNSEKLISIRNWLEENKKRFPKNQEQIDAINNALDLLDSGSLSKTKSSKSVSSKNIIPIYKSEVKFKTKTNDKNMNLCYQIEIYCDITKDYPFVIKINNFYAPITTTKDGLKNIQMTKAEDKQEAYILLQTTEWYDIIATAMRTLENFETIHFGQQFKKAEDASYHNSKKQ